MEEQLISFKVARLAKEKGFNIPCTHRWYNEKYSGKEYCSTGVEYEGDRDVIWDWNGNGEHSSNILAPYPNKEEKNQCSAPTQTTLQKWLREVYKFHIEINYRTHHLTPWTYTLYNIADFDNVFKKNNIYYKSYEEALEAGLREALSLIS